MKKVFLTFAVAGLVTLTSCDKKEADPAVETTTETTTETDPQTEAPVTETEATASVEVPKFSNADVQKFADEYAAFYAEMIAASKAGDQTKLTELQTKAVEWAQKSQEWTTKMTPEDAKLWAEWAQKLAAAQTGQ